MICKPLALHEQAANNGFTHMAVITADDLTQAAANTAQTIKICDLAAGDIVAAVEDNVKTPFQNTADNAFNSTTRSVGDNASATQFTTAAEANANGTVVAKKFSNTAVGPYTAASALNVTFNAMVGKALSAINKGEYHVFFRLVRADQLSNAVTAAGIITTK